MINQPKAAFVWTVNCVNTHLKHQKNVIQAATVTEDSESSYEYYAALPEEHIDRKLGKDEAENLLRASHRISKMFEDKVG